MMPYPLLPIFTLLSVALVAISHAAALPPELYWMSVLPDTPMPKAITDVLFPGLLEEKDSVSMNTGEDNMNIAGEGGGVLVGVPHKEKGNLEGAVDGNRAFRYKYHPPPIEIEPHKEKGNLEGVVDGNRAFRYTYHPPPTETKPHKEKGNLEGAVDENRAFRYKYHPPPTEIEPHKEKGNLEGAVDGNRAFRYTYHPPPTETKPHKEKENLEGLVDRNRVFHYKYRPPPTETETHKEKGNPEGVVDGNRVFHYKYRPPPTDTEPHKEKENLEGLVDGNRAFHYKYRPPPTETELHKEKGNLEGAVDGNRAFRYTYHPPPTETKPHKEKENPEHAVDGNRLFRYLKYGTETEPHKEKENPERVVNGNRLFRYLKYAIETEPHEEKENSERVVDGNKFLHYHKYNAIKTEPHEEKGNSERVVDGNRFLHYHKYHKYNATKPELKDGHSVTIFFFKEDLYPGKNMYLQFTKSANAATFLPRQVADSIPFSSNKVDDIFNELSVKPGSKDAQIIKETIQDCEGEGIKGEEIHCATSLESMVDFGTSTLGNDVQVLSTIVGKETELQKFTIRPGVKILSAYKAVVCHKQNYPYAVFYCHKIDLTEAYSVPLEGSDGTRVKAMAICHIDTSEWDPNHLAFQLLNVKPGTVPVCHFLPEDHVLWVPKSASK